MKRFIVFFLLFFSFFSFCFSSFLDKAQFYSENSKMQTSLADKIITQELIIKGNEIILDVGCGEGKLTEIISEKLTSGSITGIDTDEYMIEYAKKHHLKPNIRYEVQDVHQITKEDTYDLITIFSAFHFFKNPNDVIYKLAKSLKKGGRIYIATYPAESPDWIYYKTALESNIKWLTHLEDSTYDSIFSKENFFHSAKKNQLIIIKSEIENKNFICKDIDEFKAFVKGWIGWFVPKMPECEINSYIETIVEQGKKQFKYDQYNNLYVPYSTILVVMEKK